MFNNYYDAKDWFNCTYRRFPVEEDFDCIVIYISIVGLLLLKSVKENKRCRK